MRVTNFSNCVRRTVGAAASALVFLTALNAPCDIAKNLLDLKNAVASNANSSAPYILDRAGIAGSKEFGIKLATNGLVPLTFIKIASSTSATAFLSLSPFYGEKSGKEMSVTLSTNRLFFEPTKPVASLWLKADPKQLSESHTATLVLYDGDVSPILWRVTLESNDSLDGVSSPVVTPTKVVCDYVDYGFFQRKPEAVATIIIQNTNTESATVGISITPGEIIAGTPFNIAKNVHFFLQESNIVTLTSSPPRDETDWQRRTISPNGQVALCIGFEPLSAGEHTFEFFVNSKDSQSDGSRQKVTVTVRVVHPLLYAGIVLVAAMFLSFSSYRLLVINRNQRQIKLRSTALRAKLPANLTIYPVVWCRMLLRQADYLASKQLLMLLNPSFANRCLDIVEPVLEALVEYQKFTKALSGKDLMIRNCFSFVADEIFAAMKEANMTKDAADIAKAEFIKLRNDVNSSNNQRYWDEVQRAVKAFINGFDPATLPGKIGDDQKIQDALAALNGGIKTPPTDLAGMMNYERLYARLYLLDERKWDVELCKKLLGAFTEDLTKYFALADDAAWEKIKSSTAGLKIKAEMCGQNSLGRAYHPIEFSLIADDENLNKTYLFRRLLKYKWCLEPKGKSKTITLEPETEVPKVVQYATDACKWQVSVKLSRKQGDDKDSIAISSGEIYKVDESLENKSFMDLTRAELGLLLITAGVTLITGLITCYYKNATFGSTQDYLNLIIWGIGIDQIKNQIQSLSLPANLPTANVQIEASK